MSNSNVAHIARYRASDGTPQRLEEHLQGCSALAEAFTGKLGLPLFGELGGLLHDLGKYSDEFQAYLKSSAGKLDPDDDEYVDVRGRRGKIDHSSAGAQYLWDALKQKEPVLQLVGQILSLCLASHHSGLIDCLSLDGTDTFSKRMCKRPEQTHLDEVVGKMDKPLSERIRKLLNSSRLKDDLLNSLQSLWADRPSLQIREFRLGLLVRFLFSALIDADRLDSAERKPHGRTEWGALTEKFEEHIATFKIRNQVDEIRADISSSCLKFALRNRGLYQLTVPTGGGKTLASLRFALHHAALHQMDRIIYVVPYTSIIDQNAAVVRDIFEPKESGAILGRQVVLEHHSNLTPENDTWQTKILSENWDAPIVYTTAVQLLETLFASGTRGPRRMHQLANAVIIFDEIQTMPIKTIHLFNNAINFLVGQCGSTVVFCTATQPLLDRVDADKGAARLAVNPNMMSDTGKLFKNLRRVEVFDERKAGGWQKEEISSLAQRELALSGSVLIVMNTKTQARNIYKLCNGLTEDVYHLSTSMCPAHRLLVLDQIKACLSPLYGPPKPVICVSTQLIEAGVDVDFGSVIRSLAGLDSVAQAAGRCNRNGWREKGRVWIVNVAIENLDKLPDIRIAQQITERVLDEFKKDPAKYDHDRLHPALMERFYEYNFFNRSSVMVYPVSPNDVGITDNLFSLLSTNSISVAAYSRNNNNQAPPLSLRQSFKTAAEAFRVIDAPTEGVIVPYGDAGKRIIAELAAISPYDDKRSLLKQAQRYSVNMFPNEIAMLKEKHRLHPAWEGSDVLCLDSRHYSGEFGASAEQVGLMETLII